MATAIALGGILRTGDAVSIAATGMALESRIWWRLAPSNPHGLISGDALTEGKSERSDGP
jgi:hypothetical protein